MNRWPPGQGPDGVVDATELDELLLEEIEHLTAEPKRLVGLYASFSLASNGARARAVDQMDQTPERVAAKALDIHVVAQHAFLRRQWRNAQSARVGEFNQESELGKAE
jgi:hypothetical protein